jgi:ABC-type amino acid transport substrate-binding protein
MMVLIKRSSMCELTVLRKLFLWTAVFAFTSSVQAVELTVHGAVIPEYSAKIAPTLNESSGLMIELSAAAFKRANLQIKMARETPWSRAQMDAMHEPGGILAHLSRTPAREDNWQWLTIMYTDKVYAYTLSDQPTYTSYEEIKKRNPRVGAKLGSASESLLKGMGVEVDVTPDLNKSFLKLLEGRLDVLLIQGMEVYPALEDIVNSQYGEEHRSRIRALRRVAIMDIPLWVVTSKLTPEADVQTLNHALQSFKQTSEYLAIIRKYETKLANLERN